MARSSYDDILKSISLIGDESTGKTTLILTFKGVTLPRDGASPTISVDFLRAHISIPNDHLDDHKHVNLHIWDTAGREMFHNTAMNFLRGAHINIFMIVFAVNKKESFERAINYWLKKIQDDIPVLPRFPGYSFVYLIGTKIDFKEEREVSQERAQSVADKLGIRYFEIISHCVNNVNLVFQTLGYDIIDTNNTNS